jgi:hypothetical protein
MSDPFNRLGRRTEKLECQQEAVGNHGQCQQLPENSRKDGIDQPDGQRK